MDVLLQRVKTAEVRHMRLPAKVDGRIAFNDQPNINWPPRVHKETHRAMERDIWPLLNGATKRRLPEPLLGRPTAKKIAVRVGESISAHAHRQWSAQGASTPRA
jgi:hypothetical protein